MQLIVIEGVDATGTTTQADLLAELLRAHGVNARSFHHTNPRTGDPLNDALRYAEQRRSICRELKHTDTVLIADRWWHTAFLEAEAHESASSGIYDRWGAVSQVARQEPEMLPQSILLLLWLDAPDRVLDTRMRARGEVPDALDRARRFAYRRHFRSKHQPINTDEPIKVVTLKLAELVFEALGVR